MARLDWMPLVSLVTWAEVAALQAAAFAAGMAKTAVALARKRAAVKDFILIVGLVLVG